MSDPAFRVTRFSPTYDMAEVDAFLDRARRAIDGQDPLTAAEARSARFTSTGFAKGYDATDVDQYLDEHVIPHLPAG